MAGQVAVAAGCAGALTRAHADTDLPTLVATMKASVVAIGVHAPLQSPAFRFSGTGFAVGTGNQIVTCAHVLGILDPARRETLSAAVPGTPQRILELKPIAINRAADIAVLQFEGAPLPALPVFGEDVQAGTDVVLVGFPLGTALGLFAAAHRGIVAALTPSFVPARHSDDLGASRVQNMRAEPVQLLQLDATAYPGNSGSPLVDAATGKVVGVVNATLLKGMREAALSSPSGISYAVPSRYLSALLAAK